MAGVNNWTITGNLTRDPELRHLTDGSGKVVCNMGVAVNGFKEGDVLFVDVSCWGKGGEAAAQHLSKGSQVAVQGSVKLRSWQKQDGGTGFGISIPDGRVTFLGGGNGQQGQQGTPPAQPAGQPQQQQPPQDDIPF